MRSIGLCVSESRRSQNGNFTAPGAGKLLRTVDPEAACIFTGSRKCQPAMTLRWRSYSGSALGERTVGSRSRGPACDAHRGGAGARAGCALCPAAHGPRPTGWWRPTAPCSTSMCGRCCGASMPRSTQASSGLRPEGNARRALHGAAAKPSTNSKTAGQGRPALPHPRHRAQPPQRKGPPPAPGSRRSRRGLQPRPQASDASHRRRRRAAATPAATASAPSRGLPAERATAAGRPAKPGPQRPSPAPLPHYAARARRPAETVREAGPGRQPSRGRAALVILGIAAEYGCGLPSRGLFGPAPARIAGAKCRTADKRHRSRRSAEPQGRPPAGPS